MVKVIHERYGVGEVIATSPSYDRFDVLFDDFVVEDIPSYDLQEVSKKTLGDYITKAAGEASRGASDHMAGSLLGDKEKSDRGFKQFSKRHRGILTATSKLVGTARVPATEEYDIHDHRRFYK